MIYHPSNPFCYEDEHCIQKRPCCRPCCCIPVCCCPMPPHPHPHPCDPTTIRIGTTTTGAPGTPAMVTNSGTDTDVILNFTIPAGMPGHCCCTPAAPVNDACNPSELLTQFNLLLANMRAAGLLLP